MTTTCLPPVVSHPECRHRIRVLAGHDVLIGDVDVHEVITVVERLPSGSGRRAHWPGVFFGSDRADGRADYSENGFVKIARKCASDYRKHSTDISTEIGSRSTTLTFQQHSHRRSASQLGVDRIAHLATLLECGGEVVR